MKNYAESVETNHIPNSPYILDHHLKILIIGGPGSGGTKVLLNLIKLQRPDFDKFICISKIHSNQNENYLSTEEKNRN